MKFLLIIFLNILYFLHTIHSDLSIFNSDFLKYLRQILHFDGFGNLIENFDPSYPNHQLLNEYDFIIVGAGPAGCVLANRLSENPNWKILLLEAGGVETIANQIPLSVAYLQGTDANWGYKSVPQNLSCFGMRNNVCSMPRGKMLGGSSSINYMIYNRGNHYDFDRWAEAGNPGWSYDEVLPYFRKTENANLKNLQNSKYHGRHGLLSVEDVPYRTNLVHQYIQAAKETGYAEVDYNGETQLGVSYVQATTKKGQRHSAARSFLYPIRNRSNLHIKILSRVTKILINNQNKMAYGVQMKNQNKFYEILVRKEVILSAGAFNSPQLLMLSGIGPKKHLNFLQIPLIQNLPVGQTMYDHMSHLGPTFIVNTKNQTFYARDTTLKDAIDFTNGYGRLTTIGGVEALTFLKTPNSQFPHQTKYPDIELIFVPGGFSNDEGTGLKEGVNLRDDIYEQVYLPIEKLHLDHVTMIVMLFHPLSYGTVELRNRDPFQWPILDPKYFQNENDIETLLHGIKAAIRIMQAPAMQKLGARLHDIPLPGCEHLQFASDDYWRCSIRTLSGTLHHQVGTCKMGPETDASTVVNHQLKVHGIERLRVADTSIIPFPITGHTNADSFMIGEKAADMIKANWKF